MSLNILPISARKEVDNITKKEMIMKIITALMKFKLYEQCSWIDIGKLYKDFNANLPDDIIVLELTCIAIEHGKIPNPTYNEIVASCKEIQSVIADNESNAE